MKQLTLKSPAKLNLYLKILNKRPDGFHNIETVFEKIDLCDEITLTARNDRRIRLISNWPALPKGASNLAFQAANLFKQDFSPCCGVDISIKKNIPVSCGLGGGSSNAATVLLGLNRLWKLRLSRKILLNYAQRLGSDVAFFINEASFALGRGRGERIRPLPYINKRFWHVLVLPKKKISSKTAYQFWDKKKIHWLTTKKGSVRILLPALQEGNISFIAQALYNSFEPIAKEFCPQILNIQKMLRDSGVRAISLSGKGPAVFGMVLSKKEATEYKRLLGCKGWSVYAVKTF